MNATNIKNILEAAIMVSSQPLTLDKLEALFTKDAVQPDRDALRSALAELAEDCNGRGVELVGVASGWRYQVRADYADWVNRLWEEKPARYSRALMETLAIIAYRQPITRSEIEDIRGVSVSANIVRTLQEREWIKSVGHRDVPGKPELLATTKEFLDYFNLKKLSDLPTLAEIRDLDEINPDLFAELDKADSQAAASDASSTDSETEAEATEAGDDTTETVSMNNESAEETTAESGDASEVEDIPEEGETDLTEPAAEADEYDNHHDDVSDQDEDDSDDDDTDKVVQFSN